MITPGVDSVVVSSKRVVVVIPSEISTRVMLASSASSITTVSVSFVSEICCVHVTVSPITIGSCSSVNSSTVMSEISIGSSENFGRARNISLI